MRARRDCLRCEPASPGNRRGVCARVVHRGQAAVRRSVSTPRLQHVARCRLAAIASRIEGREATCGWLARAFPRKPPAATGANEQAECKHGSGPPAADVSIETHRRVQRLALLEELAASGARDAHLGSSNDDSLAECPRPHQQAPDGCKELGPWVGLAERSAAADEWPCEAQAPAQEQANLRCDSTVDTLSSAASCPSLSAIWDRDLSFSSTDESRTSDLQHDAEPFSREEESLSCQSVDHRLAAVCPDARAADVRAMTDDRKRASSPQTSVQLDTNGYLSAALSSAYTPPVGTEHRGASQTQATSNDFTGGAQEGTGEADNVVLRRMILQQELEWTRQALESRKTHLKRSRLSQISPTVAEETD